MVLFKEAGDIRVKEDWSYQDYRRLEA